MGEPSRAAAREDRPGALVLALAAVALAAAALLWRMVAEPFDHGYVRYLGVAAEMVRSGDWVVPRIDGAIYLHKPPLFVWTIAAPIALLGSAPGFLAHLPNLVAFALSIVAVQRFARDAFGRRDAAWLAALVFATSFEVFAFLREKRLDPLFAAFLAAAFALAFRAWREPPGRDRLGWTLGAWAFVALATMVKGPLALAFFLVAQLGYAAASGRLRELARREQALGLALWLGGCAVWPALVVERLGLEGARHAFAETPLTTRFAGPLHYLWNLPVQDLPWTLVLPALAVHLVRGRPDRERDGVRYALVAFVAIFALLNASSAKHSRYLLPAFAPLAVLAVTLFYGGRGEREPVLGPWAARLRDGGLRLGVALLGAATLAAPLGVAALWWKRPEAGGGPASLGFAAAFAALAIAGRRRLFAPQTRPFAFGLLALGLFGSFDALRATDFSRTAKGRAAIVAALAPIASGAPAAIVGLPEAPRLLIPLVAGRSLPTHPAAASLVGEARRTGERSLLVATDEAGEADLAIPGVEIAPVARFELARIPVRLLRVTIAPGEIPTLAPVPSGPAGPASDED